MQKAIRRGLSETAVATAIKLLAVDAPYFWRRILVIGFEDIGYGDIALCHDLLKTFRREALHRNLGVERVAGYFSHHLAQACKNRTLCDALAILEFSNKRERYEYQCYNMTANQLIDTAIDMTTPVINRVAALRHLSGYRVFESGTYRTVAAAPAELRRELAKRARLTETETTLFLSGNGATELMNACIPLAAPMVKAGRQWQRVTEYEFEGRNGVLFCSQDRHVRAGKRCFARLVKENQSVRDFFTRHRGLDSLAVIGNAIFIIEGCSLNRQLLFAGSTELRRMFEKNFLEYVGISHDLSPELLTVVSKALDQLNSIRAEVMG